MSEHTPGPWEIHTANGRLPIVREVRMAHGEASTYSATVRSVNGDHVCKLDFGYGKAIREDTANARLIAAAPELLTACEAALNDRMYKDWPPIADLLIAAIAKATGTGGDAP